MHKRHRSLRNQDDSITTRDLSLRPVSLMEFTMYKRIVVPLDGSEIAETAIIHAEQMATLTNAPIHLIRVLDYASYGMNSAYGVMADAAVISAVIEDEDESARTYMKDVVKRISSQGYGCTFEIHSGHVPTQLIDMTQADDLIVMASHGRSGVARWFLGSVAEEVVRRSEVPVLLIKAPGVHAASRKHSTQVGMISAAR